MAQIRQKLGDSLAVNMCYANLETVEPGGIEPRGRHSRLFPVTRTTGPAFSSESAARVSNLDHPSGGGRF
jgi:hypothetical protein